MDHNPRHELIEPVTRVLVHSLKGYGFGPNGFCGSFESLVIEEPSVRDPATLFGYLHELGVSLDGDFHHIYCSWAEVLTKRNEPLPKALQWYLIRCAKWGRPKQDRGRKVARDLAIAMAVEWVCDVTRLRPTRNETSLGSAIECGCSVVADALERIGSSIPEKTIANIYTRIPIAYRQTGVPKKQA